jgi:hypothetical protein
VHNLDGMMDVLGTLGMPRSGTQLMRRLTTSKLFTALPRAVARAVVTGLMGLGMQRMRIAASPRAAGTRIRSQVGRAIAAQGGHYRSWGLDLGVSYPQGFVVAGSAPDSGIVETYTPAIRAGGRLPHAWLAKPGARRSTLDVAARDRLTVLAPTSDAARWQQVSGYPLRVCGDDLSQDPFSALKPRQALLIRPDGHIAAVLDAGASSFGHALTTAMVKLGLSATVEERYEPAL